MWARCAAAWLEAAAAVMARVVAEHRESQSTVRQPRDEPNHKRVFHRTDPLVLTSLSETLFLWLLSQISKHWQVELAKWVTKVAKRYRSNIYVFNTGVQHLGFSSDIIPQTKNDSDLKSSHLARPSQYRRPTVVDDIWEGGWAPTKIQHLHLQGAIHLLEWSRTFAIDPILKDLLLDDCGEYRNRRFSVVCRVNWGPCWYSVPLTEAFKNMEPIGKNVKDTVRRAL